MEIKLEAGVLHAISTHTVQTLDPSLVFNALMMLTALSVAPNTYPVNWHKVVLLLKDSTLIQTL